MIKWDEGARDDRDVHEVPEVPEVRARMKNEADVDHLQTNGNKLTCSYNIVKQKKFFTNHDYYTPVRVFENLAPDIGCI